MSDWHAQRQLRLRVLEALEDRVKGFRRREELWPLRVPADPVPLASVIDQAVPEDRGRFDPASLKSRTLLQLQWEDGSSWAAWVCVLPSGLKLYCDTGDDESRILASGGRNEGDESDRMFLALLAESGGSHFGMEMSGGAPSRVRSSIADRGFLVDLFVDLFEVTGAEETVHAQLAGSATHPPDVAPGGTDFRSAVERWLDQALRHAGRAAGMRDGV